MIGMRREQESTVSDEEIRMTDSAAAEHQRLRAMALAMIANAISWTSGADVAISALGGGPLSGAWKAYRDIDGAEEDQWFYWRDLDAPNDEGLHVDQVSLDEAGRIDVKHGCGLFIYTECQPCRFAPDVAAAVKAYQERLRQ